MRRAALPLLALLLASGCGNADHPRAAPPVASPARALADSLRAAGEALYEEEAYDSARAVWTVALRRARAAHDDPATAELLTWLSIAAWRLGDLPEARGLGEEALRLKLRLGSGVDLSRSYNTLGLIALGDDRNADAARLFQQAADAARAAGDAQGAAKTAGNLGLAYTYLGDLRRAREGHRTLRAAGRALHDARFEGNGLANEAMVDLWEGDPRAALARLDTARALYRRIGYATGEQNALGQAATAYELTGEYDRAFAALDSALLLARAQGLKTAEAEAIGLIADLHARVGDYRRAVRGYADADSLMRAADAEADRAAVLRGAARAQLRLGDLRRARADAGAALRLNTAGDEPLGQLDDQLLLAEVERRTGDERAADARLAAARPLAERAGTRGARIAMALAEARIADLAGDAPRALRALRAAAPALAPGDYGAEWEAAALAARAFARTGALDSAVAAGRRAVAAVERVRGNLASEALRATVAVERSDVYGDLVLALLRKGRTGEAFGIADAARSRALLEHLSAARRDTAGALPGELLRGEALLRQIDALVQRLRETGAVRPRERGVAPDTTAAALAARLAAARAEYESLALREQATRSVAGAVLGSAPARLGDVARALEPGEVLLEYLLVPGAALVFAVRSDGVRVVRAPIEPAALVHRVRLLRELWGAPGGDWRLGVPAARALYASLVTPVEASGALAGARRLLVVPHGVLGQIPFPALVEPTSGRFLVERYATLELPSAAALPVLRRAASPPELADGAVFAPFPRELPASRVEAGAVRDALPGVAARLGAAATEHAVRRALAGGGLVHVATHGVLNARSPMFSRIELARPTAPSPGDDGRLEVHELLGLRIHAPLVFLSGCETGAGTEWEDDPVRGTADLTLAQAFLSAGAANVVSTLWRVDDAGAAAFAARFYAALRRAPAADAFAAAQRELAADPRWASPYYWAAYLLSGEGRLGGAQERGVAAVP